MVVEDTVEHRQIFGDDGAAVVYFDGVDEMVYRIRMLLQNDAERSRLSAAATRLITGAANTYEHRLATILNTVSSTSLRVFQ